MADRSILIDDTVKIGRYLFNSQLSKYLSIRPKFLLFLMYLVDIEKDTGQTCYASDLCKFFGIKSSQMTNLMTEMEDKGWVELKKSERDGRKNEIIIKEEGYRISGQKAQEAKKELYNSFESVTEEELQVLNRVMRKLLNYEEGAKN